MAWARLALLQANQKAKAHLDDVAKTFGYSRRNPTDENKRQPQATIIASDQTEQQSKGRKKAKPNKALFWQIKSVTELAPASKEIPAYLSDPNKVLDEATRNQGTYQFELPEPIIQMARLVPLLFNALGEQKDSHRLNHKKLSRLFSKGKPVTTLPKQIKTTWPQNLTIIVDKHRKLFPYWHDFDVLVKQLQKQLGEDRVTELNLADYTETELPHIPPETAVLMLSDLQEHNSNTRFWLFFSLLQRIQRANCKVLTLSPDTQSSTSQTLCRLGLPQSLVAQGHYPRRPHSKGFSEPIEEQAIENALAVLSVLPLVDRGLFRKLNKHFKWGGDGLDGVIWNDPRVVPDYLGLRIKPEYLERYHKDFQTNLSLTEKAAFKEIFQEHHKNAYQGLKNLEIAAHEALTQTNVSESIEYYESLLATYRQQSQREQSSASKQQLRTLISLTPHQGWKEQSAISEMLHQIFAIAYEEEIREGIWPENLPADLDVNKVQFMQTLEKEQDVNRFQMLQTSMLGKSEIRVSKQSEQLKPSTPSEVLLFLSPKIHPPTLSGSHIYGQRVIRESQQIKVAVGSKLRIKAINNQWDLQAITRSEIAKNMGNDKQGLFMETRVDESESRVYWHPEQISLRGEIKRGVWFTQALLDEDIGRDQFGLYKDIVIKDLIQRFRWIEPDSFMMGSPEDEPERSDDEIHHQVTLTQGFWLADTACTQELWQAVMGDNPARFKESDELPVEQVSWNDVTEEFLPKLAKQTGLQGRLPSEAEWEYACRAGTTTLFNLGENFTSGQVNFNGKDLYNNGQKGQYRGKTVAVKSMRAPNAWGLHEMHGNVWEWCQDWYDKYPKDAVQDPTGPKSSSYRVVRGGSWFNYGRHVRSACRYSHSPGYRYNNIGFRLALGQPVAEHGKSVKSRSKAGQMESAEPKRNPSGLVERLRGVFKSS